MIVPPTSGRTEPRAGTALPRWQLVFAAAGVLLAAADTYVVVVALPSIMGSVGIGLDHIQRATPVVTGFLLGYIAVLPLLGRLADLVGRRPVFVGCLVAFATGSLITATAHGLGPLVAGRAIQGLGGGGLVPVTLSLVAAHWPPQRRGLPLGVVGAVQELGSLIGPLYGAAVVDLVGWRWIFWINLPLAGAVVAGYLGTTPSPAGPFDGIDAGSSGPRPAPPTTHPATTDPRPAPPTTHPATTHPATTDPRPAPPTTDPADRPTPGRRRGWAALPAAFGRAVGVGAGRPDALDDPTGTGDGGPFPQGVTGTRDTSRDHRRTDSVGLVLGVLAAGTLIVALDAPAFLAGGVDTGRLYSPVASSAGWAPFTTPVAFVAAGLILAWLAWEACAPPSVRTMVDVRSSARIARQADLPGGALLAGVLACVVIAFSTTDPGTQVVASSAVVLGPVAAGLVAALVLRQRRATHPLLAPAALRARPAWGSMVVNLAAGIALIAALVDVPLFARATSEPGSQVGAALVLVRFLAAVPVGAVLGGLLCRRPWRGPWVAGAGLAGAALAFASMTSWSATALTTRLHAGGARLPVTASDAELVLCGLGFGLAIAPVNSAILGAVPARLHGLASSLTVVARTVGMLVGLSVLTALALHRFYRAEARIGSPLTICPRSPTACPVYQRATTAALLGELHTIFLGAAVAAAAGGALSIVLLRIPRPTSPSSRP